MALLVKELFDMKDEERCRLHESRMLEVSKTIAEFQTTLKFFDRTLGCQEKINKEILTALRECPESGQIKKQNGKIDALTGEVLRIKGGLKFWSIILTLILGVISISSAIAATFGIYLK